MKKITDERTSDVAVPEQRPGACTKVSVVWGFTDAGKASSFNNSRWKTGRAFRFLRGQKDTIVKKKKLCDESCAVQVRFFQVNAPGSYGTIPRKSPKSFLLRLASVEKICRQ